jgi:hypothetical protein
VSHRAVMNVAASGRFERSAGAASVVAGISGLLYSVAFVIVSRSAPDAGRLLSALLLLIGGVVAVQVLSALYLRLRDVDRGFALTAYLLGFAGALGSAIHGAYDLANALHPPAALPADVPDAIDPRGFLTFGLAGLALLVVARLMSRGGGFPAGLAVLGSVSGILLVLIYLGRLVVLDASSALILGPAAIEGFIVNPAWYIWLGLHLWRRA